MWRLLRVGNGSCNLCFTLTKNLKQADFAGKKPSRLFNSGSEEGKAWYLALNFFLIENVGSRWPQWSIPVCSLVLVLWNSRGGESRGSSLKTFSNSSPLLLSLTSQHHLWDKFPYLCSLTVVMKCQHMTHWGSLRSYRNHSHLTAKRCIRAASENASRTTMGVLEWLK